VNIVGIPVELKPKELSMNMGHIKIPMVPEQI
jgi:hypothetical protein